MNEEIKTFLEMEDLDELQLARIKLRNLDDGESQIIRSVIEEWSNPQSVSNLLFYPAIIPEDIRSDSVIRGLTDRANSYHRLAATVGLEDIDRDNWRREDVEEFRDILLEILETDESVLADRASVAILPFLGESNIGRVASLLSHSSETVRHNLLGWLYESSGVKSADEFIDVAGAQNLSCESQAWALEKIQRHENAVAAGGSTALTTAFFAYIPNLKNA